jgi:ABC-type nitrate/sulfonate/bicarbonate transport system ATPase subunit
MSICISDITFAYSKDKSVLSGINISIPKGETLAIVGASGCGKSTLLRLISGILPKNQSDTFTGKISIDGLIPNEYIKKGKLAFMFQEATLMPNLTVRENIALPLKIKGSFSYESVDSLIQTVGLTEYSDYLPKQLSGGMKTRVALARSFVTNPELLLLDEPFSALDIAWKSKLYIELEKLREQYNTTVVIVTHDVQEALLLANNISVFSKNGTILSSHNIKSNKTISERVNDITDFMSEVYSEYMLPIQDAIINDKITENEKRDNLYFA